MENSLLQTIQDNDISKIKSQRFNDTLRRNQLQQQKQQNQKLYCQLSIQHKYCTDEQEKMNLESSFQLNKAYDDFLEPNLLNDQKYSKTNNIIKNIIKQYLNYLLKPENKNLVQDFIFHKPYDYCRKIIKKYFKQITYNNQSLIRLIQHEQYGKGLEYFLTFDASEELQNSKVKNLNIHLSAISLIKDYCVNRKLLDQINFYKKKTQVLKNMI
ncbi:hypothetical protein ABPG74_011923 [Tetrahymena malaccensis]